MLQSSSVSVTALLFRLFWPLLPSSLRLRVSSRIQELHREAAQAVPRCNTSLYLADASVTEPLTQAACGVFELSRLYPKVQHEIPACTVLMTCKNEANGIEAFLDSLYQQTHLPNEVVIVDGGSTDGTCERMRAWHARVEPPWQLHVVEAPGASIAEGRNRAMQAAQHEILLCTDAGVLLHERWCASLLLPFVNEPEVEVVAGWYSIVTDTALLRGLKRFIIPELSALSLESFLPSARSFACRRVAWQRAGGFPEYLHFAGEDTLFMLSLRSLTKRWAFVPDATVVWQPPTRGMWKTLYRYAKGDVEAGTAMSYYVPLWGKFFPLLGDVPLVVLLFAFSLWMSSSFLFVLSLLWCSYLFIRKYRYFSEYQPFFKMQRDGTTVFWRVLALCTLLSAQLSGSIAGMRARGIVRSRRRRSCEQAVVYQCRTPLKYPSAEWDEVAAYLAAGYYVVVCYQQAVLEPLSSSIVRHPKVEQWSADIFTAAAWEQTAGMRLVAVSELPQNGSPNEPGDAADLSASALTRRST